MSVISDNMEEQLVVFTVGADEYGISISVVREIINESKVVKLPQMPSSVLGVLNLRGQVVPVVDLSERLGMKAQSSDSGSRKILIIELGDKQAGYLVTGVSEVLSVPTGALEPPSSALNGMDHGVVEYICKLDDRLFPVLSTDNLFGADELDEVEALVC